METNVTPGKGSLARKLAKILGEIGKVPKTGHNSFHNYDYVTENDLVYAVRTKLADAGIFVFSSVESQRHEIVETVNKQGDKSSSLLTSVCTKHTFVDGDSGEEFSVLSQGQGADNGDKGGYKAITGAMKYFLYKCFMIPTGDDPEADDKTDERGSGGVSGRRATNSPSNPPRQRQQENDPQGDRRPDPEIRRETSDVSEREEFEGGKWAEVAIHFGKNYKGVKLGDMTKQQLAGWLKWTPTAFNGSIAAADRRLRIALDVAAVESE